MTRVNLLFQHILPDSPQMINSVMKGFYARRDMVSFLLNNLI
jgi:hypothetical protein